jgi:acetoacetate decarboxylase
MEVEGNQKALVVVVAELPLEEVVEAGPLVEDLVAEVEVVYQLTHEKLYA